MSDEHLREEIVRRRVVHEGRFMTFRVDTIRDVDGREHTREIVDHPGAVAILPLDGDDLLLVRQWRLAAGRALLELPAGTLDRRADGTVEPPDEAAPRELAEETGHTARSWRHLGRFWTAPGFATELMYLYLATDLVPLDGYEGPAPDERLDLVRVPWRDAIELVEGGGIVDAKTIVGVLRLARLSELGQLPGPAGAA